MKIELLNLDCLTALTWIEDASIDLVLTDPPYGTTACKWDTVIPFEPMWRELERIIKPDAAICLFGSEPFSSALRMSNIKKFKYDWIWEKDKAGNFASCKKNPMKVHEIISVFCGATYYPIMQIRPLRNLRKNKPRINKSAQTGSTWFCKKSKGDDPLKYPTSIQKFKACREYAHPTQKPVALLEYLIKTYTLEGQTVLDFTMGSGSTGVACKNLNRNFIGIEKDEEYFKIAEKRILGK